MKPFNIDELKLRFGADCKELDRNGERLIATNEGLYFESGYFYSKEILAEIKKDPLSLNAAVIHLNKIFGNTVQELKA